MNRCPITYEECGDQPYSQKGLNKLSKKLTFLKSFPYSQMEQLQQASASGTKISISGVQPKFGAKLNVSRQEFEITEKGGNYIFKPGQNIFPEVPQNEDLTMRLAATVKIETPFHGMIYCIDQSLTYLIRRFDRISRNKKLPVEDFAQLSQQKRDTKYQSTMEKLIPILDQFCTFPAVEKVKLFRLTLFNFIVGNEDMHLKNFSLIRRSDKVELSPAYDLLNTTIILPKAKEEIALSLRGKKRKLRKKDLLDYYGQERLNLTPIVIEKEIQQFEKAIPTWEKEIQESFLSPTMQEKYWELVQERWSRF